MNFIAADFWPNYLLSPSHANKLTSFSEISDYHRIATHKA